MVYARFSQVFAELILFAQQGHLRKPRGGLRRFAHGLRRFTQWCVNRKKVYARFSQVYVGLRSFRAGQLADVGQDTVYVHCTIFSVLSRTNAVFPTSALQQKRAVPTLSLICLSSQRFPAARWPTSLATRRLLLSNARHCTVLLHLHLLHRDSKSHAWASTGK